MAFERKGDENISVQLLRSSCLPVVKTYITIPEGESGV